MLSLTTPFLQRVARRAVAARLPWGPQHRGHASQGPFPNPHMPALAGDDIQMRMANACWPLLLCYHHTHSVSSQLEVALQTSPGLPFPLAQLGPWDKALKPCASTRPSLGPGIPIFRQACWLITPGLKPSPCPSVSAWTEWLLFLPLLFLPLFLPFPLPLLPSFFSPFLPPPLWS